MSQYHPTKHVKKHSLLSRTLCREEYESAIRAMEDLGFRNGRIQDMESYRNYLPDFRKNIRLNESTGLQPAPRLRLAKQGAE